MKTSRFNTHLQSGKVVVKKIGNATQVVLVTKHKDNVNYQVGEHGDFQQEKN